MLAPIPGYSPLALRRFQRDMARIHGLGCRTAIEHAAAVARLTDPMISLAVAERFARLDPARLIIAGADRPLPYHLAVVP